MSSLLVLEFLIQLVRLSRRNNGPGQLPSGSPPTDVCQEFLIVLVPSLADYPPKAHQLLKTLSPAGRDAASRLACRLDRLFRLRRSMGFHLLGFRLSRNR